MRRRRTGRWAAVLAATLLACELLLWALGYNWINWYRADRERGWALRPGLAGWYIGEGRSFVRINAAGYRDLEHALEKPLDVYRIAVLGDAYSEAMQVALEASYWAQLPGALESCAFGQGKRVEVLNFGVRDYGTAQSYLVLEKVALRYRPDLVLLQFSHGNDLRDNYYPLDPVRGRPYFTLAPDGALRLEGSFASERQFAWRASPAREFLLSVVNHSRVLQLGRHAAQALADALGPRGAAGGSARESDALKPPRDARWTQAWRVTEALIAKIGEAASRHGAQAAVVVVPFPFAVQPQAAERERLRRVHGVSDLSYPDQRVVAFARHKGMLGILLEPDMVAVAEATGSALYHAAKGHWNELGHRTAAQVIARTLCAARDRAGEAARAGAAPHD